MKKETGFTLIEMMVVIFILGLLALLVVPRYFSKTEQAKRTQAAVQIKNFETALELFYQDNGFYPSTEQGLIALIKKPDRGREAKNFPEGGYLGQEYIPKDPWGNNYAYFSPGKNNRKYEIISFGADNKPGGEKENSDIVSYDLKNFK